MSTTELTFLITYLSLVIQIQIHNNYFNVFRHIFKFAEFYLNHSNYFTIYQRISNYFCMLLANEVKSAAISGFVNTLVSNSASTPSGICIIFPGI